MIPRSLRPVAALVLAVSSAAAGQPPPAARTLTAFPLHTLSPEQAAKELARYAKDGAVLIPVPGERTLLVYAADTLREKIAFDLLKRGEVRLTPTVLRLKKSKPEDVIVTLKALPGGPILVPVPADGVILVYADEEQTRAVVRALKDLGEEQPAPEPTYAVEFRDAPWADVFAWYGKITGLQLISAVRPPGTCTIIPGKGKRFTLAEVTDLLAETLLPHKMYFLRRQKSYFVWPSDEKVPSEMFPRITIDELPKRGKLEIVQVVIPLPAGESANKRVEDARHLVSPHGSILAVETSNVIVMMDTAGNILRVVAAVSVR